MRLTLLTLAVLLPVAARGEEEKNAPLRLDLDKAAKVAWPKIDKDLEPVPFATPDGKEGWIVRIPGGLPLATPAVAGGRLYLGGGYGSHELYAFDAATCKLR